MPVSTPAAPVAALPGEAAHSVIVQRAYIPAWREKLATDYGLTARSPQEEAEWLHMSFGLRSRYNESIQKQAAAGDPAINLLRQQLELPTAKVAAVSANRDTMTKQAAAQLATDPEFVHAALSLLTAPQ